MQDSEPFYELFRYRGTHGGEISLYLHTFCSLKTKCCVRVARERERERSVCVSDKVKLNDPRNKNVCESVNDYEMFRLKSNDH